MHDKTSRDADAEGDGWRDGCGGVPPRPICVVSACGLLHIVLHMYVARCGPRRGPARQTAFSTPPSLGACKADSYSHATFMPRNRQEFRAVVIPAQFQCSLEALSRRSNAGLVVASGTLWRNPSRGFGGPVAKCRSGASVVVFRALRKLYCRRFVCADGYS